VVTPPADQPDATVVADLARARDRVLERIAAACDRVGRDPTEVSLVAVTKTLSVERVRAGVAAGLTILGENRVQEAESKVDAVHGATWHLVGPLQSNKARRAIQTFDVIESVDSLDLARRLDRLLDEAGSDRRLPIFLQVNVDDDPAKSGYAPADLTRDLPELAILGRLEIRGLMTVGRLVDRAEDARPTFVALRDLSERIRSRAAGEIQVGPELSMGMTDDFEVAVEEGATIVRVGRALFGERS
jgi:pyridoxal phosphate enzyme (YggS family)